MIKKMLTLLAFAVIGLGAVSSLEAGTKKVKIGIPAEPTTDGSGYRVDLVSQASEATAFNWSGGILSVNINGTEYSLAHEKNQDGTYTVHRQLLTKSTIDANDKIRRKWKEKPGHYGGYKVLSVIHTDGYYALRITSSVIKITTNSQSYI